MQIMITACFLMVEVFAPYGNVLDMDGVLDKIINQGFCGCWHDCVDLDFGPNGRVGISLFKAELCSLFYMLDLLECYFDGSQVFFSMSQSEWLVIVASDDGGVFGQIEAFIVVSGQGINLYCGMWYGVLTLLHVFGLFVVVDWIGDMLNLEEFSLMMFCIITC